MVTSTPTTNYYYSTSTWSTSNWTSSMGPTAVGTSTYYHFPRDSIAAKKRKKMIYKTLAMLMPAGELFEM